MEEQDKEIKDRQQEIHDKGFSFGKINIGVKTLEDAQIDIDEYKKYKKERHYNKIDIFRIMADKNIRAAKEASDYFYRTNGIYQRLCNYYATMYRWDWYVVPSSSDQEVFSSEAKSKKMTKAWLQTLDYLDHTHVKKLCGDIALKILKYGPYYCYISEGVNGITVQELPAEFCRSRYSVNGMPTVEFNMSYFDNTFHDVNYRLRIVNMFPEDFQKGYMLYKQGKLPKDYDEDYGVWYLLEPGSAYKFTLNGAGEMPYFFNVIPYLMDLDAAQELDHKKQMQELLKIIIQKLPRDKNGDLLFDVDEARDIHNNAVAMLKHTVGTDIITTFADIDSIDLSDSTNVDTDDLERAERTVYNAAGVSSALFNTDGNLALSNSILQDEGVMRDLKLQFELLYDTIIEKYEASKKYNFKFYILDTTQYNYKDLSKMYKEQMQIGYGKMLAQIALGHSQRAIMDTAYFENEVLGLSEVMIPPMMSSTIGSEDIQALGNRNKSKTDTSQNNQEAEAGRPAKEDSELSDKTIANKESAS